MKWFCFVIKWRFSAKVKRISLICRYASKNFPGVSYFVERLSFQGRSKILKTNDKKMQHLIYQVTWSLVQKFFWVLRILLICTGIRILFRFLFSPQHEYMSYMAKKTHKRQTAIISLSDQNQQELEKINRQKQLMLADYEEKKSGWLHLPHCRHFARDNYKISILFLQFMMKLKHCHNKCAWNRVSNFETWWQMPPDLKHLPLGLKPGGKCCDTTCVAKKTAFFRVSKFVYVSPHAC